jgi:NAD+ kinase
MKIKKIGILYHPKVKTTFIKAKELEGLIKKQGISTWIVSAWEKEKTRSMLKGTDLVLTIGGDGTILRAVQSIVSMMFQKNCPNYSPVEAGSTSVPCCRLN